ncbi:MAG: SPOR domain-containing protein [Bacteroidota bacterium]|nr:SPOR domain-containing protein [Bacteroidota bacterium]MDP4216435.1 SPOR domain-containing protein [Bacteroidota bacterium]MDP4244579.1 SPOR domain-containing protein [Bacteroidota bacterium]MDP4253147.1 SPOR domain-containing protein [Bacteroidota bacterium]MDP4257593.1 SPOR domain-containing protein [Bacteroidota bacterium]
MHRTIMFLSSFLVLSLLIRDQAMAQVDSGTVIVHKDPRVDDLVRKQIQINEETTRDSRRNIPGFRIQVINSTDRNKVFAAKTRIYQEFPDLKPYLLYQAPNYKLRVGNFRTQEEAEEFEKQLTRLFPSGLFIIRDVIEVSPNDMPLPNP